MKGRRIAALVLALVLTMSSVGDVPTRALEDSTVYVQKHVSLLYDNSGSMSMRIPEASNLKWCYASYAAQVFTGLLNDIDTLSITFMNNNGRDRLDLDLTAERQSQVTKVLDNTAKANGGTPLSRVNNALSELLDKGLLSDEQLAGTEASESEQYWLVLTTDGNFTTDDGNTQLSVEAVETALEDILKKYSNLQVVYFGIGAAGDTSEEAARDFRESKRLTAYPNFTAVYAEGQGQIISTMQALSNQISGRYGVTDGVQVSGNTVTLDISGETSPIRNIALLAQNTNAKLLSAQAEDGTELVVSRSAEIQYPYNASYSQNGKNNNMPEGTLGGCTAMVSHPDGKLPVGTIRLTFSEPVAADGLSLMYEPAIYVRVITERRDASGAWTEVPSGVRVTAGDTMRVRYEICEDGTDTPLEESRLPGKTEGTITCGDQILSAGTEFAIPAGNSLLTVDVSMMDGAYRVTTTRTLQAVDLGAFAVATGGPITLLTTELEENESKYVEFSITCEGNAVTPEQFRSFRLETGGLEGEITSPKNGVLRFVPRQIDCAPGAYSVKLFYEEREMCSETVTVEADEVSYTAETTGGLAIFNNVIADNTEPVIFHITSHRKAGDAPMTAEESELFRIEAVSADGTALKGAVAYAEPGQLMFTTSDASAPVGDYTVSLWWEDQKLAETQICILQYNAQYTVEAIVPDDPVVDRFGLRKNQTAVTFVVKADGVPCSSAQLAAMLEGGITVVSDRSSPFMKVETIVGQYNGAPAVIARPTSSTRLGILAGLHKVFIAWGGLAPGEVTITLTVDAEKGDSGFGVLELSLSATESLIYIILTLVILALLVLLGMFIYSNLRMTRITPGTIRYYSLRYSQEDGNYRWNTPAAVAIKTRLHFRLLPGCQTVIVKKLRFTAESTVSVGKRGFSMLHYADPTCILKGKNSALSKFTHVSATGGNLAQLLRDTRNRCLHQTAMAGFLGRPPVVQELPGGDTREDATVTVQLHSDHCILRESSNVLEIWAFSARQRRTVAAKPVKISAGKRKPAKTKSFKVKKK